jgi:hypothetical protein
MQNFYQEQATADLQAPTRPASNPLVRILGGIKRRLRGYLRALDD